jgi:signal transduction histidine kinase
MKYRVLMVDDERESFEFIRDMLGVAAEDQFALTWEYEFEVAAAKLLSNEFDVCLLDYNMGSYTGFELMNYARQHGTRVPLVFLTGHGSREIDMDALQAGAAEYLDKTQLKPVLLSRTIRYVVRRQRDRNQLEDLYQQVRELEQLKTDMIRIAAHDLRTPLMSILNYTQFLQQDQAAPLADHQQEYTGEIMKSVRHMQQIISDILSLERIQETSEERYAQRANLTELIQQAADVALRNDRDLKVKVTVPSSDVIVRGDPAQLREAASNMIGNAVKYTPDGERITISLIQEGDYAIFRVTDTGYGIPEKMQSRLFQPFYRAKFKETRRISGTGLGLHLVRNIVERHDGEIIFHSVYKEGSTFGFKIPLM